MTNNEGVIITTRGLQLLTKLAASAGKLEFTKVKVGTGRPPDGTDPSGLTHLVMYKMDGLIADYGYDSEAMDGYVVMQISNAEIVSGFIMTEIGLYATDPDLGEILYAYVDLSNDPNHIMPAENGRSKTVQMKLHVIVGEVKELTATINPLAQVTRELLNKEIAAIVNPEFDASGTVEGITDKTSLLASFVTKMPLLKFLRNVVAGFKLVLYSGQIVNDCVTDRADLPGSAAQLKVLMDMLTVLNTKKAEKQWEYIGNSFNDVTFAPNKYSEIYVCAFIDDDNSKMIPFLLPLETIKHGPDNSITNPRFAGASLYNGWALLHYNDGLIRMQSSSAGSTSIYVYGR